MTNLFHSVALDQLAQRKCEEGCRENIKEAADEVMRTGISDEIIAAMKIAEARGFLHPDLNLTLVQINQALLFFKINQESVKALISPMTAHKKNSVPVPPKVLIKMCAIRLKKLVEMFKAHNREAEMCNRNRLAGIADPSGPHGWAARNAVVAIHPVPEELRTMEAVTTSLALAKANINQWYGNQGWAVKEVENSFAVLIAKPELADEHISAGWDLVITGQVMSE